MEEQIKQINSLNSLNLLNNENVDIKEFNCNKYKTIPLFGNKLVERCNKSLKACDTNFKDVPYIGSFLVSLCKYISSSTNEYEYNTITEIAKPILLISAITISVILLLICILYLLVFYVLFTK